MHLIERYALSCGVKIDEPFIYDKFFPLTIDRYITVHTTSKNSKNYDYWQEVVDILLPILQKAGIGILQIGGKDNRPLNFVYQTLGQTTVNQTAYILKNSLLHMGTDSFPIHIASYYNIPIIGLYANTYANCSKPYWGNPSKQVILEPARKGFKPSFAFDETPKSINTINPETIASEVCRLLGLNFDYGYSSVFIGWQFGHLLMETVPNQLVRPQDFSMDAIIVRMDFDFNEQVLQEQLSRFKCVVFTDKPINPQILVQLKPNIIELNYNITKNHNPQFVQFVQSLGIKYSLFSFLKETEIEKLKLEYMDLGLIHHISTEIPEIAINKNQLYYKSSKFTLSQNKIYPSRYAWLTNQPIDGIVNHLCPVPSVDDKHYADFWKEKQHFRIVEKN